MKSIRTQHIEQIQLMDALALEREQQSKQNVVSKISKKGTSVREKCPKQGLMGARDKYWN